MESICIFITEKLYWSGLDSTGLYLYLEINMENLTLTLNDPIKDFKLRHFFDQDIFLKCAKIDINDHIIFQTPT
jgi:hypothetical protein